MGTEREVKLRILEEAGFRRLLSTLADRGCSEQHNIYFDTPDHALGGDGRSVRVRVERGRVLLTVKSGASFAPGRVEVSEWEMEIAPERWNAILSGRAALEELGFAALEEARAGRRLVVVGELRNVRHRREAPDGGLYELDETHFPWGETHYELEVETEETEAELARATALLDRLGIAYSDRVETKHERLLRGRRRL